MITLTRPQRVSVHRKWSQDDQNKTYKQFRQTVLMDFGNTIMVHWCGMWLGIEADGYTHS